MDAIEVSVLRSMQLLSLSAIVLQICVRCVARTQVVAA